jgi:hypothetical protein
MSLAVQKIDSIRCRIGARCSRWVWRDWRVWWGCGVISRAGLSAGVVVLGMPRTGSSARRGRTNVTSRAAVWIANSRPAYHRPVTPHAVDQDQSDLTLTELRGAELQGARGAVGAEDGVQTHPPEVSGMRRAVPVIGGISDRTGQARVPGALDRLARPRALHLRAVDQQQIVIKPWTLAREHAHQPLQCLGQPAAAFEIPRLLRQIREQVPQALIRDGEKPTIRRDPHDRLRDTQRDDLRVCDSSRSVLRSFGQEIVGRDEHGREQQVEVGVHSRPPEGRRLPLQSTADFDPAALYSSKNPSNTAATVESTT